MKIGISYYYHIRFFKSNQIPVATTLSTPPWYRKNNKAYLDKRGIVNGIRCVDFVPGKDCNGLCKGPEPDKRVCDGDPAKCEFLQEYRKQLGKLKIEDVMNKFEKIAAAAGQVVGHNIVDPEIVLIVYEAFDKNPCSEANSIIDYFKSNGIDIEVFKGNAKEDKLAKEKAKYDF